MTRDKSKNTNDGTCTCRANRQHGSLSISENDVDLILYTAKNCGPCFIMKKKLELLKNEIPFHLKTVDVTNFNEGDVDPEFLTVPTLKIIKSNDKIIGDLDMDDLKSILYRSLYSP
ncbi:MAG: glutaredoxin family protein [Promethearchaeota archaeon]